jgi:hypothetical protein
MAKTNKRKLSKDEANVDEVRTITVRYLAKNKKFNMGYDDYSDGIWRKEYDNWSIGDQWQYERGRQYAAAGGPEIKCVTDARVLRNEALYFIGRMLYDKAMI